MIDHDLFADDVWQMAYGERAAIEGLLCAVRPVLAVEIGTAEGASLRRIAAHSTEVHSFDLVPPKLELPGHVTVHTGDAHELLPAELARIAGEGRNVDFVLVDGDHSAAGVRRDIEDLLSSDAVRRTVIVAHDTGNERVRAGLDAVDYAAWPKVVHVDLDFVPGHLGRDRFGGELWYGLGLVIVDADDPRTAPPGPVQTERHHGGALLAIARDAIAQTAGGRPTPDDARRRLTDLDARIVAAERRAHEAEQRVAALEGLVDHHRDLWQRMMASPSWRVTAPLRAAKRRVLARR